LFTENTLEPVIPLLHNRDRQTLMKLLRLWSILLIGNLVGTAVFALALAHTAIVPNGEIASRLRAIAERSTGDGFGLTLVLIWLTTAPIAWLDFFVIRSWDRWRRFTSRGGISRR
jgi:formate/nitrite transporter FocA (FNT family)